MSFSSTFHHFWWCWMKNILSIFISIDSNLSIGLDSSHRHLSINIISKDSMIPESSCTLDHTHLMISCCYDHSSIPHPLQPSLDPSVVVIPMIFASVSLGFLTLSSSFVDLTSIISCISLSPSYLLDHPATIWYLFVVWYSWSWSLIHDSLFFLRSIISYL